MLALKVNGGDHQLDGSQRPLVQLLSELGYEGSHFAVAVNGDFVPRGQYASFQIQGGEALEVLSPMQGG